MEILVANSKELLTDSDFAILTVVFIIGLIVCFFVYGKMKKGD